MAHSPDTASQPCPAAISVCQSAERTTDYWALLKADRTQAHRTRPACALLIGSKHSLASHDFKSSPRHWCCCIDTSRLYAARTTPTTKAAIPARESIDDVTSTRHTTHGEALNKASLVHSIEAAARHSHCPSQFTLASESHLRLATSVLSWHLCPFRPSLLHSSLMECTSLPPLLC